MKRLCLTKSLIIVCITSTSLSSLPAVAQVYDFEPSPLVVGPLASPATGPYDFNTDISINDPNNKAFVGQDLWSDSIANDGGAISTNSGLTGLPYAPDGLYDANLGVQALDTGGDLFGRYVGARPFEPTVDFSTPTQFSLRGGYDLYVSKPGDEGSVGPWVDRDDDDLFDRDERAFHVGAFADELFPSFSSSSFGVTTATGVTYYATGLNGGVTTDIQLAMPIQDLGWHNVAFVIEDHPNNFDFLVTVEVQYLSAAGPTGDFVDFDSSTPTVAEPFTLLLTPAEAGLDRVVARDCREDPGNRPEGIFADVHSYAAMDNFDGDAWVYFCACVPEPGSMALLLLGGSLVAYARPRSYRG